MRSVLSLCMLVRTKSRLQGVYQSKLSQQNFAGWRRPHLVVRLLYRPRALVSGPEYDSGGCCTLTPQRDRGRASRCSGRVTDFHLDRERWLSGRSEGGPGTAELPQAPQPHSPPTPSPSGAHLAALSSSQNISPPWPP